MAFCGKCGAEVQEGVRFCPSCGQDQNAQPAQNDFNEKLANMNNTADTTGEFDPADIEKNKVMAVLAYLGILILIPIFAAKESRFARYHCNQGLILLIANIAFSIVTGIINGILDSVLISSLLSIVSLVFLVLAILGIVNAAKGQAKELPIIGKYQILK